MRKGALAGGLVVVEQAFVGKLGLRFGLVRVHHQLPPPAPLILEELARVGLLGLVLDACAVLEVVAVLSLVGVLEVGVDVVALAVEAAFGEGALVVGTVVPYELALSVLLALKVLALVDSFIIMF